jgi:hypothetical protein
MKLGLAVGTMGVSLALAALVLIGGRGEPASDQLVTTASVERIALAQAESEDEVVEAVELPTVAYEVYLSRDPFEPVRTPPPTAPASSDDGGTVPVPDDGPQPPASSAPPNSDPGTPPAASGPGTCTDGDEVICDGHVVTLNGLTARDGARAAVVQVDSTVYTVVDGEVFADSFRVLRVEANGAWLAYGDVSFWLEVGRHTLK